MTIHVDNSTHGKALRDAMFAEDLEATRNAVKGSIKINNEDVFGDTPLTISVRWGNLEVVELLLNKGANANMQVGYNLRTALHDAARYDRLKVAEFLIDKGANPKAKDEDGDTPLHVAAERGYPEIAKLLIDKGADPKAKDEDGDTPTDWAKLHGYRLLHELLDGVQTDAQKSHVTAVNLFLYGSRSSSHRHSPSRRRLSSIC